MSPEIDAQLVQLSNLAQFKRSELSNLARRRMRLARYLNLLAGLLALFSAGSITTIIADFTNSMALKILSAATGFLSGLISLLKGLFIDEKETNRLFEGAAKFLVLRDAATLLRMQPNITDKQAFESLARLHTEYQKQSAEYDRFLDVINLPSRPPEQVLEALRRSLATSE